MAALELDICSKLPILVAKAALVQYGPIVGRYLSDLLRQTPSIISVNPFRIITQASAKKHDLPKKATPGLNDLMQVLPEDENVKVRRVSSPIFGGLASHESIVFVIPGKNGGPDTSLPISLYPREKGDFAQSFLYPVKGGLRADDPLCIGEYTTLEEVTISAVRARDGIKCLLGEGKQVNYYAPDSYLDLKGAENCQTWSKRAFKIFDLLSESAEPPSGLLE